MTSNHLSRRRFLHGVAGAAALWPLAACRQREVMSDAAENLGVYDWSGIGFGIEMSMELHGVTAEDGDRLGKDCENIIQEIERAISLYQEDSGISRLNRERILADPSPHFSKLLELGVELHARTLGYYQPAIHGAWSWLEKHGHPGDLRDNQAWLGQCAASDLKHVGIDAEGPIRLLDPLTQLSMNAIGQGYLADVVARHLRLAGVVSALLHLGESYAIGSHPDGRLWKLAVSGTPGCGGDGIVGHVEFRDSGLAVSARDSSRLLIDPVSRDVDRRARVVAVVSSEGACVADAYATAFAVAPDMTWPVLAETLKHARGSQVWIWEENELKFNSTAV